MKFQIGNKSLGKGERCLISLEPGGTYNNVQEALQMSKACSQANADAVKFQTFLPGDAERMMEKKDITVDFQTPSGKKEELVLDALKRRELSKDEWKQLVNYTKDLNLLFITAPYFPETIDFLVELDVDAIKVSKGDINNVIFIEKIAKTGLPIILDGREKFYDVEKAIKICEKNENKKIVIMHCPSGYPAENAGVNLRAIPAIQQKYDYPVGFADHSPGEVMNYAAVAMGVNMLEKTITTDKKIEHVEHFMSLELNELSNFVKNVRNIEDAMGDASVLMTSRVSEDARRCFVAKNLIKKGELIKPQVLDFKRPGNIGISVSSGFEVLNKKAKVDISEGTVLQWDMLE